jgi:hypothetical protein
MRKLKFCSTNFTIGQIWTQFCWSLWGSKIKLHKVYVRKCRFFFLNFRLWKFITLLGVIIMDSNLAGTFDDSFITDSNYLKWKLVIFKEQFSWKTEVKFLVFKFLQLRQSVETTSEILLEFKKIQIFHFSLIVLTKVNHFWQKFIRNVQPKNSYQLWNFLCNFF